MSFRLRLHVISFLSVEKTFKLYIVLNASIGSDWYENALIEMRVDFDHSVDVIFLYDKTAYVIK